MEVNADQQLKVNYPFNFGRTINANYINDELQVLGRRNFKNVFLSKQQ